MFSGIIYSFGTSVFSSSASNTEGLQGAGLSKSLGGRTRGGGEGKSEVK